MKRQNLLIALAVFVVSLLLRVPLRSHYAYHWDSAQFALAIDHYDMRISQPHTPGYFIYVMLGRVVNSLLHDPHASLVWVSVVSGALLAVLGFWLGSAMFSRECGIATAVILATSPACWFHSEVAFTNILDGTLVTATVLMAWLIIQKKGGWWPVVLMGVLFAAVAGNRQQSAPLLVPLCAFALYRGAPPRLLKAVVAVLITGVCCFLWFIPMVMMSGGLPPYLECLEAKRQLGLPLTGWHGGWGMAWASTQLLVRSCLVGLLFAVVPLGAEGLQWSLHVPWQDKRAFIRTYRDQLIVLGLWLGAYVGFGILMYTLMPGQVLGYFAGLAVVAGLAIDRAARRLCRNAPTARWGWLAIIAAINVLVFLCLSSPRIETTMPTIRRNDALQAQWFKLIRERYRPEDVVICHREEFYFYSFRHFQYHLPEYRNELLTYDSSLEKKNIDKLWVGEGTNIRFVDRFEPGNAKTALLVVPPGWNLDIYDKLFALKEAKAVDGSDGGLYEVPVAAARAEGTKTTEGTTATGAAKRR